MALLASIGLTFLGREEFPPFYPPWTEWVVSWLNWPALVGLTFASVSLAAILRSVHVISFASVFLSLPLLWTLFLGQLDGLVLLGVLGLPLLAPLAMIKPQVAIFSFGARREYLLALLIVLTLSFLIWGFWPVDLFEVWTVHEEGRYVNDIAIGLLGLPIALVLFWFSRGDVDMLMLAGCFMTPYLLPYNLVVVAPAIARLSLPWAVIACLFSWLTLSANWLGPAGWWLGWVFVIWLWIGLALKRYRYLFSEIRRGFK